MFEIKRNRRFRKINDFVSFSKACFFRFETHFLLISKGNKAYLFRNETNKSVFSFIFTVIFFLLKQLRNVIKSLIINLCHINWLFRCRFETKAFRSEKWAGISFRNILWAAVSFQFRHITFWLLCFVSVIFRGFAHLGHRVRKNERKFSIYF